MERLWALKVMALFRKQGFSPEWQGTGLQGDPARAEPTNKRVDIAGTMVEREGAQSMGCTCQL